MRMIDAWKIIALGPQPKGYRVHFEHVDGSFLRSDYFPDYHESLIDSEERAWELAKLFAEKTVSKCVNVYVVDDRFNPVKNYRQRMIKNRSIPNFPYETSFTTY